MIVRQAQKDDVESLVLLLGVLFSIEADFCVNSALQRQGLLQMLDNETGCLLVADADGQVVGMCSGHLTVSTAEGGPALLVEDVVVHQDFRGKGIGTRLMESLVEWGKAKGVSRFQLLADRNNTPALDFYTKLGWQTTSLICLRKVDK